MMQELTDPSSSASTSGVQDVVGCVPDISPDMMLPAPAGATTCTSCEADVHRDVDGNAALLQNVRNVQPEMFAVDSLPCENKTPKKSMDMKESTKWKRNSGLSYTSMHSGKRVPARLEKPLGAGCDPEKSRCVTRNLMCVHLTDDQRRRIRTAYFETGDLQAQREWLARYIEVRHSTSIKENSRRDITVLYSFPTPVDMRELTGESKIPVCKKLFVDTLGISYRQIRTVTEKTADTGVLQKERRGGRSAKLAENDKRKRAEVRAHINRFPRMESHFCRQSTGYEHLSSDLNLPIMFDMYKAENPQGVSRTTYIRVFNSMKLKFHTPKKIPDAHTPKKIPDALPRPAYVGPTRPKLSEDKYKDRMALARGNNPVIKHPDHVQFYTALLPH